MKRKGSGKIKTYKEIDPTFGCTIAEAVSELITYGLKGEFVCCTFNGVMLYSDTVSLDSAHLEIIRKPYFEYINQT